MKRWKMLACATMVVLMIFSMIGCGGDSDADSIGDSNDSSESVSGDGEKIVWRLAHTCTRRYCSARGICHALGEVGGSH